MIGIDLFSGAGGMTLGALRAGIDVKFAVEYDKYAALTYSHNNPKVTLFNDDIRKIKEIPIKKGRQQLVVFGGPPCQGFSTSNQKTRNEKNPNNWMFSEFIRVVKLLKPEWVVFENVKGFKTTNNGLFFEMTLDKIRSEGYTISTFVLNASDFGVPQSRDRVFVIGSIDNVIIDKISGREKIISVKDAIFDLPILRNGSCISKKKYRIEAESEYAKELRGRLVESSNNLVSLNSLNVLKRYKYVPSGGNWKNIPTNLMKSYTNRMNCHSGIYYRLKLNEPSVVIGNFRKNMLIHPTQNRGLSVREAARLQSFPDSYEFFGKIGEQQQQVGNAVPPLLAQAVFSNIQ
mgnify:CR=1 FL=1